MLGAIVGDIVGSRFEYNNIKRKDFQLFTEACFVTDDTVLTLAVCDALLKNTGDLKHAATESLRAFSRHYADKDYGDGFRRWMLIDNAQPYGSFGNGAAMRVSPCSIAAQTLEETKIMSEAVTSPTHNHPEGLKGAQATAVAGFSPKRALKNKISNTTLISITIRWALHWRKSDRLIAIKAAVNKPFLSHSRLSLNPIPLKTPFETPSVSEATATLWPPSPVA